MAVKNRLCWETTNILFGKHIRYTIVTCIHGGRSYEGWPYAACKHIIVCQANSCIADLSYSSGHRWQNQEHASSSIFCQAGSQEDPMRRMRSVGMVHDENCLDACNLTACQH